MIASHADLQYVLPVAHAGLKPQIEAQIARHPKLKAHITLIEPSKSASHLVLEACDAVMLASGTATLEAALYKRPMVVAYRMPRVSWWMLKGRNYLPYISLPNILCNEALVPELIQDACTPQALAKATLSQLDDSALQSTLTQRFTALHHELRQGCADRVAEVLRQYL
jgi:lipid-A-disaccharide synthase